MFDFWGFKTGVCRTMVLDERLHFLLDAFVPLGDVDVERVIAARLAVSPLTPLIKRRYQTGTGLGNHVVN